jgi:hypothetical protein
MARNEPDSIAGRRQAASAMDCVLDISYWCAVLLVAAVGAYVFHLRWSHLVNRPVGGDPWGITTPAWIVDVCISGGSLSASTVWQPEMESHRNGCARNGGSWHDAKALKHS